MKKIIASIILMLIVTLPLTAQVKQPYIIAGAEAYTGKSGEPDHYIPVRSDH